MKEDKKVSWEDIAWQNMVEKHGSPAVDDPRRHFVILGYGKMGGIELGYGSDLDLVFPRLGLCKHWGMGRFI